MHIIIYMKNREKQSSIPDEKTVYELSDFFKNFGESTRLKIVLALTAVSHQLRILRQAKIVKSEREGKLVFYSIDDEHVEKLVSLGLAHIREDKHGK